MYEERLSQMKLEPQDPRMRSGGLGAKNRDRRSLVGRLWSIAFDGA